MKKTAIFVEGHTELIFVREFLLKIFAYQNIDLECFNLHSGSEHGTEYPFSNPNATHHFTIINAGGDDKVLKHLLKREVSLWNAGFNKIIALRDMYSERYTSSINSRNIMLDINEKFINGTNDQIQQSAKQPQNITFCYAIMETEAWFLGMQGWLIKIDKHLTNDFIQKKLGFDLNNDPEKVFFHPAATLGKIYALVGKKYGKSDSDINSILGYFDENDFKTLYLSPKCASFRSFYTAILPT